MTVEWNKFWCRVLFKEFIKHFRKLNDEQIVRDIRQSMDDLEDMVADTDTFGSQMVRWSMERAEEPFATAARENGKKGGRPRKKKETTADGDIREDSQAKPDGSAITRNETRAHDALEPSATNSVTTPCTEQSTDKGRTGAPVRGATSSTAPVRSSGPMPGKDAVRDFALDNGLDEVDAYNCWYATVNERNGCDADGNPVTDWKAFVKAWCKTAKTHRKERNA